MSKIKTLKKLTYTECKTIESFFTDDEWNAIDSALGDYQDYGDKESELASTIGNKIYSLYSQIRKFEGVN